MFKKFILSILIVIAIVLMPFAFIFASIYFTLRPEKIQDWTEEIKVDKYESTNTGLH